MQFDTVQHIERMLADSMFWSCKPDHCLLFGFAGPGAGESLIANKAAELANILRIRGNWPMPQRCSARFKRELGALAPIFRAREWSAPGMAWQCRQRLRQGAAYE